MVHDLPISRRRLLGVSTALGAMALTHPVHAQAGWPSRNIRLLVGYPPGGSIDALARIVAAELSAALGQTVIVDNRPGASSNIAASEAARAAPDGHTLLVSSTSVITANPLLYKSSFDAATDLVPVNSIGRSAVYVVARASLPVKDIQGLVALSKKGGLTFGSAGAGTPPHLAGELLKFKAGIEATHVPYKGSAPAIQDLLGNQIDYMLDPGIALPYIQTGKVKLLGVLSETRSPFFPQTPTVSEQGVAGTDMDFWYGIWAPKGTPSDAMARLSASLQLAMKKDSVKEQFAKVSAEPDVLNSEAFRGAISKEREVYSQLIRQLGITAV